MMTEELNVCVLSAPLAAIDRRALSQAWYSALHGASERERAPVEARRRIVQSHGSGTRPQRTLREYLDAPKAERALVSRGRNAKAHERCSGWSLDRRTRQSSLARRIERRFLNPGTGSQRATFSAGGKRVHVLVQASAGRVHLVAVCPPALRETVARALAQARFALASRGVTCS
jgi:hypothetical protein